jgi:hypothetical protein
MCLHVFMSMTRCWHSAREPVPNHRINILNSRYEKEYVCRFRPLALANPRCNEQSTPVSQTNYIAHSVAGTLRLHRLPFLHRVFPLARAGCDPLPLPSPISLPAKKIQCCSCVQWAVVGQGRARQMRARKDCREEEVAIGRRALNIRSCSEVFFFNAPQTGSGADRARKHCRCTACTSSQIHLCTGLYIH